MQVSPVNLMWPIYQKAFNRFYTTTTLIILRRLANLAQIKTLPLKQMPTT